MLLYIWSLRTLTSVQDDPEVLMKYGLLTLEIFHCWASVFRAHHPGCCHVMYGRRVTTWFEEAAVENALVASLLFIR